MALLTVGDIKSHRSVSGRSAISVCTGSSPNYNQLGTARTVGATDGTVDISPNQEIVKLQSSALTGAFAALETGFDYQVTFNLQEFDIWNIALALSYNSTAVTGSTTLVLGEANQSSLRGLLIKYVGAVDTAGDAVPDAQFEFFKVKIVSNGGISFDRTGAAMLPVVAHCLHNSSDNVGRYLAGNASGAEIVSRAYEAA